MKGNCKCVVLGCEMFGYGCVIISDFESEVRPLETKSMSYDEAVKCADGINYVMEKTYKSLKMLRPK